MEFWGFVGGERGEELRRQRVERVQFSSVQDGIYALGKGQAKRRGEGGEKGR